MHWLWFATASVIFFSSASLFQRLALKEKNSDPIISAVIFQLLIAAATGVMALFIGFKFPPISVWIPILFASALYATGTQFIFRGIKIIEASEMIIVTTFGTIMTLIVSYIFLNERLSIIQLTGAFLILLATLVVKLEHASLRFNKGVMFALLGSSCYGIAVVIDGFVLKSVNTFSYLPISNVLSGLIILLAHPYKVVDAIRYVNKIQLNLVIYSLLYAAAAIMFYIPIQSGVLVSQMSASNRASILLTVLLSMIILRERDNMPKKIISAIITTIGVMLIR